MKTLLIIVAFLLMGCVTTQPKVEVGQAPATNEATQEQMLKVPEPSLSKSDVAKILMLAINDIEKQRCKAEFLSERGGYIWCRCKDGIVKYYGLEKLIEKYREGKQKAREAQDVKKTGGN